MAWLDKVPIKLITLKISIFNFRWMSSKERMKNKLEGK
jgi:hypothetical protein